MFIGVPACCLLRLLTPAGQGVGTKVGTAIFAFGRIEGEIVRVSALRSPWAILCASRGIPSGVASGATRVPLAKLRRIIAIWHGVAHSDTLCTWPNREATNRKSYKPA